MEGTNHGRGVRAVEVDPYRCLPGEVIAGEREDGTWVVLTVVGVADELADVLLAAADELLFRAVGLVLEPEPPPAGQGFAERFPAAGPGPGSRPRVHLPLSDAG